MKKKYLVPGIIVAIILLFVFWIKDIFPFGNKFIAWGDMHAQVLALYYNFYDIVYSGKSFLIDFTGGTATNLISNFSYYIISPFTFIILLFERSDIPQAVSLIVLGKMVLSAITCNLFLDKKFDKLSNFYKCFFSILYALSTYNLSLYIITGWIDIVYLFPLLLLGLDNLLNKEKITLFLVILSFCLIFNFYIALMCIVFIFFISFIYLLFYGTDNKKRKVTLLGISVILSILISSIFLIPTIMQILSSARMGINFGQVFNSKTGPLIDKFLFLSSSSAMICCILLLLREYKKNKKWILFFLIIVLLVGIGLIIEPINKMLHFGSYVYYPYRYGFILIFLLIIGACFYLNKEYKGKKKIKQVYKILMYGLTLLCSGLIIFFSYNFYSILQQSVDKLSFSHNHFSFAISVVLIFLNFVPYIIVFSLGEIDSKTTYICLMINLVVFSICQSLIYIKIDCHEEELRLVYDDMNYIYNMNINDSYHFKQKEDILIYNYGSVIGKPSLDFFTSLTDNNMFIINQKLGFTSMWMNTTSINSNYFIDFILANKYLVANKEINNELYKLNTKVNDLYLYETTLPISLGYVVKENISINEFNNSFDTTNSLFKLFSNTDEEIIAIYDEFKLENLTFEDGYIKITDESKEAYLELDLSISSLNTLYFEIMNSYINQEKLKIYNAFDIYINDELVLEGVPKSITNGSINLGEFENENLNIKLFVKEDVQVFSLKLGTLDQNKLKNYFINNVYDLNVKYDRNKIKISYDSNSEDILFIPTTYLNGMYASNNSKDVSIIKMFDNFIGIRLNEGANNIVISYLTPGLKLGGILSILGIVLTVIFIRFNNNILSIDVINSISYYTYLVLYIILGLVFYIVPLILFVISYF